MGEKSEADKAADKQKKVAEQYKKTTGGTYNIGKAPVPGIQPANKQYAKNIDLAKGLEAKAKGYKAFGDVGQYSLVGNVATLLGKANMYAQSSALKKGGMPVFDKQNKLQGVVSQNFFGALVYTGNSAYSPIGRKDTGFDASTGSYTTGKMDQFGTDDGPQEIATATAPQEEKPAGSIATATSGTQLAQKNQALEATVGGVDRRNFLSRGGRSRYLG